MQRGYLWQELRREVVEEFVRVSAPPPMKTLAGYGLLDGRCNWKTDDPAEGAINPWDWRRHRSTATKTGQLPQRRYTKMMATKDALKEIRQKREEERRSVRERLPDDRTGTTMHFTILDRVEKEDGTADVRSVKGYLTANVYPDGRLAEIFVRIGKSGSSDSWVDLWCIACSIALQRGAGVDELFGKFIGQQLKPAGPVKWVPGITKCTSIVDLVSRHLISRHGSQALGSEA